MTAAVGTTVKPEELGGMGRVYPFIAVMTVIPASLVILTFPSENRWIGHAAVSIAGFVLAITAVATGIDLKRHGSLLPGQYLPRAPADKHGSGPLPCRGPLYSDFSSPWDMVNRCFSPRTGGSVCSCFCLLQFRLSRAWLSRTGPGSGSLTGSLAIPCSLPPAPSSSSGSGLPAWCEQAGTPVLCGSGT